MSSTINSLLIVVEIFNLCIRDVIINEIVMYVVRDNDVKFPPKFRTDLFL